MRRMAWTILAGAVLLAGCAQTKVPEEHFYRLDVDQGAAPAERALDGALAVERFLGDVLVSQRPLVYRTDKVDNDLRQYSYHFWVDAPPRMLQELTVDALRVARVAQVVVTPDQNVQPDYELTGKIKRLEVVRGEAPAAAVELELTLNRVSDDSLVWLQTLSALQPAADQTIAGAVAAMSEALARVHADAVASLARLGR